MARSILQIYVKDRDEAYEFYQKAFDAEIGYQDVDENGNVIHRELNIGEQAITIGELKTTGKVDGENIITGNTMQFCLQFGEGNEDKVKKAYEVMLEGSKIITPLGKMIFTPCGVELIDKYGVWWCLFA